MIGVHKKRGSEQCALEPSPKIGSQTATCISKSSSIPLGSPDGADCVVIRTDPDKGGLNLNQTSLSNGCVKSARQGKSGVAPKVLAATTNGSYGNQTFGITTGTLGCQANGVITSRARLSMFMGTNSERLARDMSVGHGESLDVLANLMNIKTEDKGAFFQAAKVNFGKIFAPENQTAGQVLAALQQVMAKDAVLAAYQAS